MSSSLAAKLDFVVKALSLSRARLAAELGVDKSAVGRWITGVTSPSPHNLSQITALVAARIEGFTSLDWERDFNSLAEVVGVVPPERGPADSTLASPSLSLPLMKDSLVTLRLRGGAYEGFYRTTRPYGQQAGQFIHDYAMIRAEADGFLKLEMNASGVMVEGQVMLLQNQVFFAGAELTGGAFVFAIFNGVSGLRAGAIDGLILFCALDPGRTPTASAALFERIGDLTKNRAVDDARFAELGRQGGVATEASAPAHVRKHLVRNEGLDLGPDFERLLSMPLARSLSRGLTAPPTVAQGANSGSVKPPKGLAHL